MRMLKLGVGVLSVVTVAACSSDRSDTGAEPVQVFASGTLSWGDGEQQHLDWDVEAISGYSHAVSFRTTSANRMTTRSASRQGPDDRLWFVAAPIDDGVPAMVFGGAAPDVDQVVLVDGDGVQVELELEAAPDRDWRFAVQQLPPAWLDPDHPLVDVVALTDGDEVAREPLPGLT